VSRLEPDGEHILIESEWAGGGPGPDPGADIGWRITGRRALDLLRAGEAVVIADAARDARAGALARFEAFAARATVEVPLMRDGRLRGHLFACDAQPRVWTEADLGLARETADRMAEAAERARAEAGLRDSEARFRQLAETIREVFYVIDLDGRRMDYASPAFEEVWGRSLPS
jgi:GAF domain-containing protein